MYKISDEIELLNSVDEKICRDLCLVTYNSTEDIFRVLQDSYGNKPTIAMEIIEDLDRFPPLKPNQPRRAIYLIRIIEKALCDLTKLGSIEVIKNPLMIRSTETKLF